jgi:hypothetical protein
MSNTTVARRKPCRQCGGRYYAHAQTTTSVVIAVVAALGGVAIAASGSGLLSNETPDLAGLVKFVPVVVGGFVVALVVSIIGHHYRCLRCDTRQ